MAIQHVDSSTIPLTRKYAEEFHSLPTFCGDRRLDTAQAKKRIKYLHSRLKDGLFYSPKWATAKVNGKTYRVNGGHSSKLLVELDDQEFPDRLKVCLEEFECDTEADLAYLFDQFDPPESSRRDQDSHNAHGAIHENIRDLPAASKTKATSGMAYYRDVVCKEGPISGRARVRLIHSDPDFVAWVGQYVRCRRLSVRVVVAAIYATYLKDKDKAQRFWDEVLMEDNEDPGSPTRKLSTMLRERSVDKSLSRRQGELACYVRCIHAANAWNAGSNTTLRFVQNAPLPKVKW